MTANEPARMHKGIYERLNGILKMLVLLDRDYERQLAQRPIYADTEYDQRLIRAAADIRELRRDGQRLALQYGLGEWYAERNAAILDITKRESDE